MKRKHASYYKKFQNKPGSISYENLVALQLSTVGQLSANECMYVSEKIISPLFPRAVGNIFQLIHFYSFSRFYFQFCSVPEAAPMWIFMKKKLNMVKSGSATVLWSFQQQWKCSKQKDWQQSNCSSRHSSRLLTASRCQHFHIKTLLAVRFS